MTTTQPAFYTLNDDALLLVASYLSYVDLYTASNSCRRLYTLSTTSRSFWGRSIPHALLPRIAPWSDFSPLELRHSVARNRLSPSPSSSSVNAVSVKHLAGTKNIYNVLNTRWLLNLSSSSTIRFIDVRTGQPIGSVGEGNGGRNNQEKLSVRTVAAYAPSPERLVLALPRRVQEQDEDGKEIMKDVVQVFTVSYSRGKECSNMAGNLFSPPSSPRTFTLPSSVTTIGRVLLAGNYLLLSGDVHHPTTGDLTHSVIALYDIAREGEEPVWVENQLGTGAFHNTLNVMDGYLFYLTHQGICNVHLLPTSSSPITTTTPPIPLSTTRVAALQLTDPISLHHRGKVMDVVPRLSISPPEEKRCYPQGTFDIFLSLAGEGASTYKTNIVCGRFCFGGRV